MSDGRIARASTISAATISSQNRKHVPAITAATITGDERKTEHFGVDEPSEHARNRNDEPELFFDSLSMVYQMNRKRGRINKVGEAHCEIFSVDTVTGLWCPGRTFATCRRRCASSRPCTLMHVRPLKQHGYRWTDEAKRYFNRTASVSCSPSSCRPTSTTGSISTATFTSRRSSSPWQLDVDMEEEKSDPQQQEDDSLTHSCGAYQDDITDEHTPIDRWFPAKPIEKIIFVGKPSYVDNKGVIYLEQEPVLNSLRKGNNAKFSNSSATDKFYSDNEPCMAKFHQDNKFYRAILRKAISCRRYKVQFIDYARGGYCRQAQHVQVWRRVGPLARDLKISC
ncbi:hypothetical protein quinque_008144 [Culex quinquefasciatus]